MTKIKRLMSKIESVVNPYYVLSVLLIMVIGFLVLNMQPVNKKCNRYLVARHTITVRHIHMDRTKVFKLRAQLSALSDAHMLYLLHHPKLKDHAEYMSLTRHTMRVNDRDGNKIDSLQQDVHYDERRLKKDRPHSETYNAMHPRTNNHQFRKLVGTAVSFILFVFVAGALIVSGIKFSNQRHYRKLYGDNNGMKESNKELHDD